MNVTGNELRQARETVSVSVADLAKHAGFNRTTVYRIETSPVVRIKTAEKYLLGLEAAWDARQERLSDLRARLPRAGTPIGKIETITH